MGGRELAEYAFHSGILFSLLAGKHPAARGIGGLEPARAGGQPPKFPPGTETGSRLVRPSPAAAPTGAPAPVELGSTGAGASERVAKSPRATQPRPGSKASAG